jgi:hypothetical protein
MPPPSGARASSSAASIRPKKSTATPWACACSTMEDIRGRSDLFAGAAAWATDRFDLARGGAAQMIDGIWASGSFIEVFRVPTILGRPLKPRDDAPGGGPDGAVAPRTASRAGRPRRGVARELTSETDGR